MSSDASNSNPPPRLSAAQPATGLGIDQSMATRLIKLGLASQGRPIDDVIARLEQADGEVWFEHGLSLHPLREIHNAPAGVVSLELLKAAKESAKQLLKTSSDADERLRGLLAYFVCVGVALAQHGQLICSRSGGEVQSVLADLSTAVPLNWSVLLAKASRAA